MTVNRNFQNQQKIELSSDINSCSWIAEKKNTYKRVLAFKKQ